MLKKILTFLLIPMTISIIISILFVAVALIPQKSIQSNASISANQLISQPQWPTVINTGDTSYMLDNYTDSQILMQAYNLNINNPKSVFSNPKHISQANKDNMALALNEVVNEGAKNETNYVYYWMGFRIFVRPLLLFCSYYNIRKIVAFLFWILLIIALISISKKVNTKTSVCLGISIAIMNPAIIFLLTFVFLIYLCYFRKDNIPLVFIFCAFGALTQAFDFYTTPIITYGIPILVLYEANRELSLQKKFSTGAKCFFSWGWGYGFMWTLKLLFATCFAGINAFDKGFNAFAGRTGIIVIEELADKYNFIKALKSVWFTVFPYTFGKIVFFVIASTIFIIIFTIWIKKGFKELLGSMVPLLPAALPVIWYVFSAQPTVIHAWFQYRSLTVLFFGIILFMSQNIFLKLYKH